MPKQLMPHNKKNDETLKDKIALFKQSLRRFGEILKKKKTIANRDSSIQRFEFTAELAWKTIQRFFKEQQIICRSPKECLREAFRFGLVKDELMWIQMIEDRNLTTHTYDEIIAEEVYGRLEKYYMLCEKLLNEFEK